MRNNTQLVIVSVPGIPSNSDARKEMIGDEVVVWNDELVSNGILLVGNIYHLKTQHGLHHLSYGGKIDIALDGHSAKIVEILSVEDSGMFKVHRPYVGDLR